MFFVICSFFLFLGSFFLSFWYYFRRQKKNELMNRKIERLNAKIERLNAKKLNDWTPERKISENWTIERLNAKVVNAHKPGTVYQWNPLAHPMGNQGFLKMAILDPKWPPNEKHCKSKVVGHPWNNVPGPDLWVCYFHLSYSSTLYLLSILVYSNTNSPPSPLLSPSLSSPVWAVLTPTAQSE